MTRPKATPASSGCGGGDGGGIGGCDGGGGGGGSAGGGPPGDGGADGDETLSSEDESEALPGALGGLQGGASGAFVFPTADGSLVCKTLRRAWHTDEVTTLLEAAPALAAHFEAHPASLVTRVYGVYSMHLYSRIFYFVVLSNVTAVAGAASPFVRFDLKGSWVNRLVDTAAHPDASTLKDMDLVERGLRGHLPARHGGTSGSGGSGGGGVGGGSGGGRAGGGAGCSAWGDEAGDHLRLPLQVDEVRLTTLLRQLGRDTEMLAQLRIMVRLAPLGHTTTTNLHSHANHQHNFTEVFYNAFDQIFGDIFCFLSVF